jgi:thiaminase
MTEKTATGPIPANSTVGQLRGACPDAWRAYTEHAFVAQIARGTLP